MKGIRATKSKVARCCQSCLESEQALYGCEQCESEKSFNSARKITCRHKHQIDCAKKSLGASRTGGQCESRPHRYIPTKIFCHFSRSNCVSSLPMDEARIAIVDLAVDE